MRLNKSLRAALTGAAALSFVAACAPAGGPSPDAPRTVSQRSSADQRLGDQEHPKILAAFGGEVQDARLRGYVRDIGMRLAAQSEQPQGPWTFTVLDSPVVNAFALPGGKIGFYTGILDIMENDDQIATVMGHEVAHVKFNHAGQRYGRTAATQAGLGVAQVALGGGGQTSQVALGALGLGAQYGVILPFSRQHELEADRYGLRYMHKAGYNVDEAVRFWEKMSAKKGGQPPEILATHPNDATRIAQLKQEIAVLRGGA